jgi:hypothetical protein
MAKKKLSDAEEELMEAFLGKYIKPKTPEEIIIEALKKAVKSLDSYYIELPSGIVVTAQELWERYQEGERSADTDYLFQDALTIDLVQNNIEKETGGSVGNVKRKLLKK